MTRKTTIKSVLIQEGLEDVLRERQVKNQHKVWRQFVDKLNKMGEIK